MPAMTKRPTTTPTAIPALLGLLELEEPELLEEEPVAVTTTVWPPTVTTEGFAVVVEEALAFALALEAAATSDEVASALVTVVVKPVR